jgi:hypothetical protein
MLPDSPNGRTNLGSVSLDANEFKFDRDGSLALHRSRREPKDADAKDKWRSAPEGQFALMECKDKQAVSQIFVRS